MTEEQSSKAGMVKGLGIGALVGGILALIFGFIPCFGYWALILGILSIGVAIFGIMTANKEGLKKGLLIAGLICAIVGTTVAGVWIYVINAAVAEVENVLGEDYEEALKELEKGLEELEDANNE